MKLQVVSTVSAVAGKAVLAVNLAIVVCQIRNNKMAVAEATAVAAGVAVVVVMVVVVVA